MLPKGKRQKKKKKKKQQPRKVPPWEFLLGEVLMGVCALHREWMLQVPWFVLRGCPAWENFVLLRFDWALQSNSCC